MLVIDSHAHIFPYLGGQSGFASAREHLDTAQRSMQTHLIQPARRVRDNSIVTKKLLWDESRPGPEGKLNANFRAGPFGRYEWTQDGEDCYLQYMPPSLQDMAAPPGLLEVMMDYAGVDKAVLQIGGSYGKLNDYYYAVLNQYPELRERLFPLYEVDPIVARTDEGVQAVQHALTSLGFRGVAFSRHPAMFGDAYRTFWDVVQRAKAPAFVIFHPRKNQWAESLQVMAPWVERYPDVPVVLPMAFPIDAKVLEDELTIPETTATLIEQGSIYVELTYPIMRGAIEDYPFAVSRRAVATLYDRFGPAKLVWGSDVPNVERHCTYAQSLHYLTDYCPFISTPDMEMIVGKNVQKLLGLPA